MSQKGEEPVKSRGKLSQTSSNRQTEQKHEQKQQEEQKSAVSRSFNGLRLIVALKLFLKFSQIILNFAVVQSMDPAVYGLVMYFNSATLITAKKLQSLVTEECFRETYQKRLFDAGEAANEKAAATFEQIIKIAARNLMNLGVFLTATLGLLITAIYSYLYGDKHQYFTITVLLYSIGALCSAYCYRLNVDPQLEFNFSPSAYSEAISLSVNNFGQAILIAVMGVDPILSIGLAAFVSGLVQVASVFWYFYLHNGKMPKEKYSRSLMLQKFEYREKQLYLLPGSIKFSLSLAYNALINDFLDQTYFVFFASNESFLGPLTLIRGFGSIFVRFLFMPVNEVTYNLYAKLYSQEKLTKASDTAPSTANTAETPQDRRRAAMPTMLSILRMLLWVYNPSYELAHAGRVYRERTLRLHAQPPTARILSGVTNPNAHRNSRQSCKFLRVFV